MYIKRKMRRSYFPQVKINADVNLDGKVNQKDATIICQYIIGRIPSLPITD